MTPKITWIVVADGARARFFEHRGPTSGLAEMVELEMVGEQLRSQDIQADKPGRAYASTGSRRSSMEPHTDPVDLREAQFVKSVAERLGEKLAANEFDRLVISAAPQALGDLRKALPANVQAALIGELNKDLVKTPANEMARHFESVLNI